MLTTSIIFRPAQDAMAKNEDLTPDTTEQAFWTTSCVAAVRVEAVRKDGGDRDHFALEMIQSISEGAGKPPRELPASRFWFGLERSDWPKVVPGDVLLIFYDHSSPRCMVVAEKIQGDHARHPQVAPLVRIAAIRAAGEPIAALREGALDGEKTVAAYCLKRLLAKHSQQIPAEFVPRLRKQAGDEAIAPKVRLLSIRLAAYVAAGGDAAIAAEEERRWLCASIRDSKSCELLQLLPLARRLWELPPHRRENVEFLTALVTDQKLRTAVRAAAADTLPYEQAFCFTSPDALSDEVLRALVSLLDDDDSYLRALGAGHVKRVCIQSSHRELCRRYFVASRAAIEKRLAAERDESARFHLKAHLESIDQTVRQGP
ncbi:MAG TPA: hypothetical protein VMV10_27305 [Pirellulales bacterium]|nr:hypothetical protein [Pirellulales bacterium]